MTAYALTFEEDVAREVSTVGGKGAGLAEMTAAGLPVAPGFVVTASAYRDFLDTDGLRPDIDALLEPVRGGDRSQYERAEALIAERLGRASLPEAVARQVRDGYDALCRRLATPDVSVAVRSSATAEDSAGDSFAGEFETWVDVVGADDVLAHVHKCYVSVFTGRVLSYALERGIELADVEMAVVVQKTVRARSAGVMFTLDPITGDRSRIVLESSWGLGLSVVGGEVNPDRYVVAKVGLQITDRIPATKHIEYRNGHAPVPVEEHRRDQLSLQDEEVVALAELGKAHREAQRLPPGHRVRGGRGPARRGEPDPAPVPSGDRVVQRRAHARTRGWSRGSPQRSPVDPAGTSRERRTAMAEIIPTPAAAPRALTRPRPDVLEGSQLGSYLDWLRTNRDLEFDDWRSLWRWSVDDADGFWSSIWEFGEIHAHRGYEEVLADASMPGAQWFTGALLNYAEHSLGRPEDAKEVAVVAHSQTREPMTLTFGELAEQVTRARAALHRLGVRRGDRVVAYLPNIPETLIAFLATASLGAVWASCAPEFGAPSIIERFGQVEPTVLLAVPGYRYGEKLVDRRQDVSKIRAGIPSLQHVISVAYSDLDLDATPTWAELLAAEDLQTTPLAFEPVPFDHPLYVLFSSGTTGQPKAIGHGHGGMLLEHIKNGRLHYDLRPGDRMLWFTTTAWMMWNVLAAALLCRASIVMIDGNPMFPDLRQQWRVAEQTQPTLMGLSPGYLIACRKQQVAPTAEFDLTSIRQLGVAGSPLPVEGYRWVNEQFGDDVLLNVGSGGTDVCTGIVQGSLWQPVWAGEMSGPSLGVDAAALGPDGSAVVDQLGELVIRRPMPSMPVALWGDVDGSRYRAAYFDTYPGIWRHGDWIRFRETGSCVITGRSDATLNRGGVRLGTSEFYSVMDQIDEVADSMVVHLEDPDGGNGELMLFVVPAAGVTVDNELKKVITTALRSALSPRHVPDLIEAIHAVPHTRTGKKLEVPVKRILQGGNVADVATRDGLADPSALDDFVHLARSRAATSPRTVS